MSYEVRCACGKAYTVGAADAGVSFSCACGREVDVPPMHLLRNASGETILTPLAQVRAAVRGGRLPGTRVCTLCGAEAAECCRLKIVCEYKPHDGSTSQAERLGGIFGGLLFGGLFGLLFKSALRAGRESAGDEEGVVVPLPVCSACRPRLNSREVLFRAAHQIPDYAALLTHYPEAELTVG